MKIPRLNLSRSTAKLGFVLTAAMVAGSALSLAEERVVLDFNQVMSGDKLPSVVWEAHLMELHSPRIEFLTAESSPPTPFPEGVHGLFVEQGDSSDARVRVRIKPFAPSQPPKVGWIEIEMVVNSDTHNGMDLGSGGISAVTSAQHSVYDGKVILGLNLNVDRPVAVMLNPLESRKVAKQGSPSPEIGVPFRLRIAWDSTGDVPIVDVSINGNVLQDPDGGSLNFELEPDSVQDGIDYVSIILRNAVLGRIFASE